MTNGGGDKGQAAVTGEKPGCDPQDFSNPSPSIQACSAPAWPFRVRKQPEELLARCGEAVNLEPEALGSGSALRGDLEEVP